MASSPSKLSLKLLIHTKTNKVIYAEAGKDFVDFLFNIPTLSLATVLKLLTDESTAGCLGNVYKSIRILNQNYLQPNLDKNIILEPKTPISATSQESQFLFPNEVPSKPREFYKCSFCCVTVASDRGSICPKCEVVIDVPVKLVESHENKKGGGGYVKGEVKYMVMDDLEVEPLLTNSIISIMHKFNVKDLGDVEEKVIDFGMDEAIKLLKISLQSKTVLSTLFLKEEKYIYNSNHSLMY